MEPARRRTWRWQLLVLVVAALMAATGGRRSAVASDLQTRTTLAYDAYVAEAEREFLARARSGRVRPTGGDSVVDVGPAREDGIISIPGGLIHHWTGVMLVPGVTLSSALSLSQSYDKYAAIYRTVVASELIGHEKNTYRARLRLRSGEAGITAVVEVTSTVRYFTAADGSSYAVSAADDIREVANAGRAGEHLLPAGRDSGYLWRANTFSRMVPHTGGLYMEVETLGLSRRFPPMLGWLIEPIARRLGRRSAESSLRDFAAALVPARAG